jgi:hypothetical protein
MYKTMYELLAGHTPLTTLIPVDHMYGAGSTKDRPLRPYLVMGWLPDLQKSSGRYVKVYEVRVHDERGSYDRIRQVNRIVSALLLGVAQFQGSDGWLTECAYAGDSGELVDPDSNTNLMSTSWEVVGRTNG